MQAITIAPQQAILTSTSGATPSWVSPEQFMSEHLGSYIWQLVLSHAVPLVLFACIYLLLLLVAHKSQADAWCMKRPRLAGFLKLVRGLGIDPWLIVQGLTLLLKARLPNYLIKLLTTALLAFMLTGCGGTLHQQIEKALVFEQQVHTYQQQLVIVAQASIAMLPVEKQAEALRILGDANGKLTLALDAKDQALQAALDASDTNFNLNQLIADIVAAVQAIVSVVNSFGANRQHTEAIGWALMSAQVKAVAK